MTEHRTVGGKEDAADFELFIQQQLGGRIGPERDELEQYLRAHPGEDVRDWKGKSTRYDLPDEEPWHRSTPAEVRALATREIARRLPRNIRQAAARDAGLVWNDLARRYRPVLQAQPHPPLPNGEHVEEGGGA